MHHRRIRSYIRFVKTFPTPQKQPLEIRLSVRPSIRLYVYLMSVVSIRLPKKMERIQICSKH